MVAAAARMASLFWNIYPVETEESGNKSEFSIDYSCAALFIDDTDYICTVITDYCAHAPSRSRLSPSVFP